MSIKRNTVKQWFKKFLKPTETQFWTFFDSIWFKDENIPANQIEGLDELLNVKTKTSQFINDGDGTSDFALESQLPDLSKYMTLDSKQEVTAYKIFAGATFNESVEIEGAVNINEELNVAGDATLETTAISNLIVDPNQTKTNIAGAVFTLKKESTSTATNVGAFYDINRNNTVDSSGDTYGVINRVTNTSNNDTGGVIGSNMIARQTGDGESSYLYGTINTAEISSGLTEYLIPDVSRAIVSGTKPLTVGYIRGMSIDINNPNAEVDYAQPLHPTFSLSNGKVKNAHILYLDADISGGEIENEFAYIRAGVDANLINTVLGLENAHFINSEVNLPSKFAGKLTTTAPVTDIVDDGDYVTLKKLNEYLGEGEGEITGSLQIINNSEDDLMNFTRVLDTVNITWRRSGKLITYYCYIDFDTMSFNANNVSKTRAKSQIFVEFPSPYEKTDFISISNYPIQSFISNAVTGINSGYNRYFNDAIYSVGSSNNNSTFSGVLDIERFSAGGNQTSAVRLYLQFTGMLR